MLHVTSCPRPFVLAFLTLVFCIGQSAHLFAAELLIVEQSDCPYCDRFNDEIGQVYAKTDEGKVAPLVRLQLRDTWPKTYESIAKPAVTPTFILVHNGKEIDRLHGYQGDEFFWFLLNDMLDKLPENVQTQNRL